MRAAALFVQLTFFTFSEPEGAAQNRSSGSAPGLAIRGRKTARRKLSRRLRAAIVMVLGAMIQFMKRVFHLIIGLLRLSYRKVSSCTMEPFQNIVYRPAYIEGAKGCKEMPILINEHQIGPRQISFCCSQTI